MNLKLFLISIVDCLIFMLLRGLYFFMQLVGSYLTVVWWIAMILLFAANVYIIYRIRKMYKRKFGHISIISGIAAGTAACYAVSFLMQKLLPFGYILISGYIYGMYMYDGISSDTAYYAAMTFAYIYLYNIISYAIISCRKHEINVYTLIIHNSRPSAVCSIKILLGAEKYLFDNIDMLEPGENIKKTIVIDDKFFLSKIKPPQDIFLEIDGRTAKIGSISDDKEKAVYVELGKDILTDHRKGRKLSRAKQIRWRNIS